MADEHAEDVTAEAPPVRQRWACTRAQLLNALASRTIVQEWCRSDPQAAIRLTDTVLSCLPALGEGFTVVRTDHLQAVLAAAFDLCPDRDAFSHCAEAAGLVVRS